jgi:hypothetical protein
VRSRELAYPLAVIGLVTLACLPLLVVGPHVGHSLAWNVSWSRGFTEALLAGEWYPRWLPGMDEGAGSPIFFFYAPVPFYFTAVGYLLCRGCTDLVRLGIGEWLLVVASALTFYAFARRHARPVAAAVGALAYALMPYHFAIDLTVRQALGETAAYVWMPLALLCVDRIATGSTGAVRLAMVNALLAMTHLPATLLFSGFLVVYSAVWAGATRSTTVVVRTLSGVALGLLLAGMYLVPVLSLQDAISPQHLSSPQYDYRRWLFGSGDPPKVWFSLRLLGVCLVPTLSWAALWAMVFRSSRDDDRVRAVAWLIFVAGAWFLMTPVSLPLWRALPVLQKVQFPWRVAIVLDLAVAATIVLAVKGLDASVRQRRAIVVGVFVMLPILGSLVFGTQWARWDLSRRQDHRAKIARLVAAGASPPEYFTPRASVSHAAARAAVAAAPDLLHEANGGGHLTVLRRTPRRIEARVSFDCPAEVIVRQFYFPGWVARAEGWRQPVRAKPASPYGLTALSLPAGSYDVDIVLSRTWQETAGLATSGLGILIAAVIGIGARRWRASPPTAGPGSRPL